VILAPLPRVSAGERVGQGSWSDGLECSDLLTTELYSSSLINDSSTPFSLLIYIYPKMHFSAGQYKGISSSQVMYCLFLQSDQYCHLQTRIFSCIALPVMQRYQNKVPAACHTNLISSELPLLLCWFQGRSLIVFNSRRCNKNVFKEHARALRHADMHTSTRCVLAKESAKLT
jgi:hypothetical protein